MLPDAVAAIKRDTAVVICVDRRYADYLPAALASLAEQRCLARCVLVYPPADGQTVQRQANQAPASVRGRLQYLPRLADGPAGFRTHGVLALDNTVGNAGVDNVAFLDADDAYTLPAPETNGVGGLDWMWLALNGSLDGVPADGVWGRSDRWQDGRRWPAPPVGPASSQLLRLAEVEALIAQLPDALAAGNPLFPKNAAVTLFRRCAFAGLSHIPGFHIGEDAALNFLVAALEPRGVKLCGYDDPAVHLYRVNGNSITERDGKIDVVREQLQALEYVASKLPAIRQYVAWRVAAERWARRTGWTWRAGSPAAVMRIGSAAPRTGQLRRRAVPSPP